ncbi:MAG: hypothetical protein ABIF82_12570 [Planctomycetota bacterium]
MAKLMREKLQGDAAPARAAATAMLGTADVTKAAPEIPRGASDNSPAVRQAAARVAFRLCTRSTILHVQDAAARALKTLGER